MWTLYVVFITFTGIDVDVIAQSYPSREVCEQMAVEVKEQTKTSATIWQVATVCINATETNI